MSDVQIKQFSIAHYENADIWYHDHDIGIPNDDINNL